MKKFLALILALVMALSLVACGSKDNGKTDGDKTTDSKYKVAMITDYGDITTSPSTRPLMRPARPSARRTRSPSTTSSPPVTPPLSVWP